MFISIQVKNINIYMCIKSTGTYTNINHVNKIYVNINVYNNIIFNKVLTFVLYHKHLWSESSGIRNYHLLLLTATGKPVKVN